MQSCTDEVQRCDQLLAINNTDHCDWPDKSAGWLLYSGVTTCNNTFCCFHWQVVNVEYLHTSATLAEAREDSFHTKW